MHAPVTFIKNERIKVKNEQKWAETKSLFLQYSQNRTVILRDKLFNCNKGLAYNIARNHARKDGEPFEDLLQVGFIGLLQAIERFDPHKGFRFTTFADPYITGHIISYLRDKSELIRRPRYLHDLYSQGNRFASQGRIVRNKEIASALNITPQKWEYCRLHMERRAILSLEKRLSFDPDNAFNLNEHFIDQNLERLKDIQKERDLLLWAMESLPQKQQAAIKYVYFQGFTRQKAAKKVGVSTNTLSAYLKKAISQIKHIIDTQT